MLYRIAVASLLATLLAACASGPPRMPRAQIDRLLETAAGEAQPSKVVAAEIAFARAARENGQWTAFREFLAPGALIHGQGGPIDAKGWLAGRNDPAEAVQWGPRTVWMSCDGAVAISQGRFREPDGTVGSFVTVWERQRDDRYLWVYDVGAPDNPQPPPRSAAAPPSDDEIIVTGQSPIIGLVADCPKRGEQAAPPPPPMVAADLPHAVHLSADRTLRWRWEHDAATGRRFVAEYLHEGMWQVALDQIFPFAPAT